MIKNKSPLLSIIIPSYNEEKEILNCIKSLKNQTYKNFEIIVVDDGSTDKTLQILKSLKKGEIKILQQSHRGPGIARNFGAKNSAGKILIFVDADMTFDKDYLKFLIKPIIEKKAIGTEEKVQSALETQSIWSRCWGKFSTDPNKKVRNAFRAILKDQFFELGPFDPKYGYADDQTIYLKHGIEATVAENAICYHKNPQTLKEVYMQSRWIGSSINHPLISKSLIKYFVPPSLIIISPLAILFFSIKKCIKNENFKLLIPWMLIFSTVRYFGTLNGIFRRIYLNKNIK